MSAPVRRPRPARRLLPPGLLRPPRLRTSAEAELETRATWFELFFDLVFVVAVAQLAHELELDPTGTGFLRFTTLFVPVWWSWVIFTFYGDRFDTDDAGYRLLVLAGMLGIVAMGINLPDALVDGGGDTPFVVSYLAVRVVPLLLYLGAARYAAPARRVARSYGLGSAVAAAVWLVSLAVAPPQRYALWGVALAIELSLPLLARRTVRTIPVNTAHIRERLGLFTIIVLGESVFAVATGLGDTDWGPASSFVAVCGFAVAACLWWIYFDFAETGSARRGFWARQLHIFGHFPVVLGLTAVGAGTLLAIEHAADDGLSTGIRWTLCGGVALVLGALALIGLPTAGGFWRWVRSARLDGGGVIALLVLAAAGAHLAPPAFVLVLVGVLGIVVVARALRTAAPTD